MTPPLEYLLECSIKSLQEMELNCLNRSQQCLRAAREEWEEAIAQREAAGVARWLIEHRPYLLEEARRTIEAEQGQHALDFPETSLRLISSHPAKPSGEGLCTDDKSASRAMRKYSCR